MIRNRPTRDFVSGLILMLLAAILYFYLIPDQVQESRGMPLALSPRLFCDISSLALFVMSVVLMVSGVVGTGVSEEKEFTKEEIRDQRVRGFISICVSILYIVLINTIGYFVSTSAVVLFFTLYFGARDWKLICVSQVIVLTFIYLVFVKGLNVILPSGILF
jgi:hypothetical protein